MYGRTNAFSASVVSGVSGYAYISCNYPQGSVVTCSNGTTTIQGGDTSGVVVFGVPQAGTWTVSCTDGTQTQSKAVNVTGVNQVFAVKLRYAFYLIENGNELITFSKTWASTTQGNGYVTYQSTNSNQPYGHVFYTTAIDVGSYTKLVVEGTFSEGKLGIHNGATATVTYATATVAEVSFTVCDYVELSIPTNLSSIKPHFYTRYGANKTNSITDWYLI